MDWLESVVGKDSPSKKGGEDRRGLEEEDPEEVVRIEDENLLFTDFSEIVKAIKSRSLEPAAPSEEEMEEYRRFIALIMPKRPSKASPRKRNPKSRK